MKKITLFVIITITFCFFGIAQEWAPVGAEWYYTEYGSWGEGGVYYSTSESVKDTVVLGKQCRKIMDIPTLGAGIHWKEMYTYESNDSIYFYHPTLEKFCMLYDFGADVGDVWEIFGIPNPGMNNIIDTMRHQVDSIKEVSINGKNFKGFYVSNYNTDPLYATGNAYIIERIGTIMGGFGPYESMRDLWAPYPTGGLRCYITDSISFHTGPYDCNEVITGLENEETVEISIFPNPVKNALFLQNKTQKEIKYKIYDLSGKRVGEGITESQIDVSHLPNGVYRLLLENNRKLNFKFVKL